MQAAAQKGVLHHASQARMPMVQCVPSLGFLSEWDVLEPCWLLYTPASRGCIAASTCDLRVPDAGSVAGAHTASCIPSTDVSGAVRTPFMSFDGMCLSLAWGPGAPLAIMSDALPLKSSSTASARTIPRAYCGSYLCRLTHTYDVCMCCCLLCGFLCS